MDGFGYACGVGMNTDQTAGNLGFPSQFLDRAFSSLKVWKDPKSLGLNGCRLSLLSPSPLPTHLHLGSLLAMRVMTRDLSIRGLQIKFLMIFDATRMKN